jgi:DNA-binding response OmpR family regulator
MRVLVLEDDRQVARSLQEGLTRAGYTADHVASPVDAGQVLQQESFDAVIVDLGLPHEDGLSFIRRMRTQGIAVPMLILTARDTLDDCVTGLDAGADDYLTKPFRLPEVLARLRALIRRKHAHTTSLLNVGRLQVNLDSKELLLDGAQFDLPPRERVILECLMLAAPNLVRKDKLVQSLAGWQADLTPNAVEVYISRLRQKLVTLDLNIRTVRGIGYRLEEPQAASAATPKGQAAD